MNSPTKSQCNISNIIYLSELAFAIQIYLEPKHLFNACIVSKTWHTIWNPYLWSTLIINLPRAYVAINSCKSLPYSISDECLGRLGRNILRIEASWLSNSALSRLYTHCLNLQYIKLQDTPIRIKTLQEMLSSLVELRGLELNLTSLPHNDKEGDESEQIDVMEGSLFSSIETLASQKLEFLKLIFLTSAKLSVVSFCSMLEKHPSLLAVKLEDADIEDDSISRKSAEHKKKKKEKLRKKNQSIQIGDSPTTLTTNSRLLSQNVISSEDESQVLASPGNQFTTVESFSLKFFSINSSHTSDTAFQYILERCSQLQAIHLHSCDRITDSTLENIVKHLPKLSSISLSTCRKLTPEGLNAFFQNVSTPLAHVHICDMNSLKDEGLRILSQRHSHSLQKLAIYFCAFITDKGIMDLLTACKELRILGVQATGMTTGIFDQPWACHETLEQLDLQGVFKTSTKESDNNGAGRYSVTMAWRDRQAKIDAFQVTKSRLRTLSRLRNLRLSAGEIGKEVLEGFGPEQKIEVLHLYGILSSQADSLPWKSIRKHYPYLKQIYCGVIGVLKKDIKNELSRLNIELLSSSSIPDLAFENNFDDYIIKV